MIHTFTTESGSTYQVDLTNKKIRRVKGVADPTPRQGRDGEWKAFKQLIPNAVTVGHPLIVMWTDEEKPFIPGGLPSTMTSRVTYVEAAN